MHRAVWSLPLLVSSLWLAGCGADPGATGDEAEVKASAAIRFDVDWSVEQTAPLIEDKKVRIEYDPARLPGCRGEMNGKPAWSITAFYSINEAEAEMITVAGFSPTGALPKPVFELEEAGDLAVWFQVTNRWGCSEYDSDFGENFHFEIEPAEQ